MAFRYATRILVFGVALSMPCAAAADGPALRREAMITGDLVRIGDLVDGAGPFADIAIFRAPDLGHTGTIDAWRVIEAARRGGLEQIEAHGVAEITVTRPSRRIETQEIEERIAEALAGRRGLGEARNLTVTFDSDVRALHVETTAGALHVARASFDPYTARFDVTFEIPRRGTERPRHARYTGRVAETVEVAVLVRPAGRGDLIRASDLAFERRPKATVAAGALISAQQIVGLAAKRSLPAAQPLRAADLMKPELVRQNELVTVVYEAPGISLTMRGKALESGSDGDTVNIVNVQTKRTMHGTVTGPNRVSLTATTPQVLATDREIVGSVAATAPQQRIE